MAYVDYSITTLGEQERVGRLKDACGGYNEMFRLLSEMKRYPDSELRRGEDGKLTFVPVS